MDPRHARGRLGEQLAAAYLRRNGYRVHETNYRCSYGEIDIVASEGDVLVFVEVRARSDTRPGAAAESIDRPKQRRLRMVAAAYLQERYHLSFTDHPHRQTRTAAIQAPLASPRPGEAPACRIDVVLITLGDGVAKSIELIRDAVGD